MSVAAAVRERDLPSLRGALHAWAFPPFVLASIVLLVNTAEGAFWPTLLYALSVCGVLGTSALYHRVDWSDLWYARMRRLDHAMIFMLIVGTWTPLCLVGCAGRDMTVVYGVLCGASLFGILVTIAWTTAPKWLRAGLFIAVGWLGLLAVPDFVAAIGLEGLGLLTLGGALYTVGGVIYAVRRPDLYPRTFGYHELFHTLVVLGATAHMSLVAYCVV